MLRSNENKNKLIEWKSKKHQEANKEKAEFKIKHNLDAVQETKKIW